MRILAFESSARAASVAVSRDGDLLAQYFQNSGLTHSVTLLQMAEDLLRSAGLTLGELDAVAVAHGPGSFTGIRIGVSAAVGLAWGAGLPVSGVSTLEAMAYLTGGMNGIICPVMDARRGQVYNALFVNAGAEVERLTPDRALSVEALVAEALVAEATTDGRPVLLLGDGAHLCVQAFQASGLRYALAPPILRLQSAWGVACAARSAPRISPAELKPVYLRPSQAERERLERLERGT